MVEVRVQMRVVGDPAKSEAYEATVCYIYCSGCEADPPRCGREGDIIQHSALTEVIY